MSAGKVIERALRYDAQRTALQMGGLRHGVNGAVAPNCNNCGVICQRLRRRLAGDVG